MKIIKDYLKSHENEIVDMIMSVLSQDEATEMYGKTCERNGIMKATMTVCFELGASPDKALNILAEDFGITTEEFLEYINNVCKN